MQTSEHEIFRVATGLNIGASLTRTLAHCLYWSQHATHFDGHIPMIWKTGPELEKELGIVARTANRHLKKIAALGYWTISYRPRPKTIGPVTWLTFTARSLKLLELASQHAVERASAKPVPKPFKGAAAGPSKTPDCLDQPSQSVTSKQTNLTAKTSKPQKSFFLSSEAGKKGMNESQKKDKEDSGKKEGVSPPGYLKVSKIDNMIANAIDEGFNRSGMTSWDWVSSFTWKYVAELQGKFSTVGLTEASDISKFVDEVVSNWEWLRQTMADRYRHHDGNLHRPTPMALACEFQNLHSRLLDKLFPKLPKKTSSLDGQF